MAISERFDNTEFSVERTITETAPQAPHISLTYTQPSLHFKAEFYVIKQVFAVALENFATVWRF